MLKYPSDVWQQHMETTYIERYNKMPLNKKEIPIRQKSVKQNVSATFRLCPKYQNTSDILLIHSINDPYWDDDFYDQEKLEFKNNFDRSPEQNEGDGVITDSHVSEKLRYVLIDLWTVNPQLLNTSPLPNFRPPPNLSKYQNPLNDTELITQLQSILGKTQKSYQYRQTSS